MNRTEHIKAITAHIGSSSELTDKGVALVWELVAALTWSPESEHLAIRQMGPVVAFNDSERERQDV